MIMENTAVNEQLLEKFKEYLTDRELLVFNDKWDGATNVSIAKKLGVSATRVRHFTLKIDKKWNEFINEGRVLNPTLRRALNYLEIEGYHTKDEIRKAINDKQLNIKNICNFGKISLTLVKEYLDEKDS